MKLYKKKETTIIGTTITGTVISVMFTLITLGALSLLMINQIIAVESYNFFGPIITTLSVAVGCIIAMKGINEAAILVSAMVAVFYLSFMAAINIVFFKAEFHSIWQVMLFVPTGALLSVFCKTSLLKNTNRKRSYR